MDVYFDNSATTKPYDEVIDEVVETMKNNFGNPSSAHKLGLNAELRLNEARNIISKTINCTKDEIIFTSGGSESNNFLIRGFAAVGSHVITSKIEHPSVLNTFKELESMGIRVSYLDVDNKGQILLEQLESCINNDTRLVSIMHVNNEIGVIQPIEDIGRIIKKKSPRVKFHVDGIQSYGKLKIDVKKAGIDLFSASGHKIHGPRGVGFCYIKKGLNPKVLIAGGGQEKSLRSGTENLPGISGLAVAVEKINKSFQDNYNRLWDLKGYFIESLASIEGIIINSPAEKSFSPYILSVSFSGIRGEVLLHLLEEKGIYVSTGSACSSKDTKESHVLKAIGLKSSDIQGTIRFSFSEENSIDEVKYTIDVLQESLKFLRRK